ncbi:MAG TPA: T9SS type A sorting domain-containing protein [bacterium]
MTASPLFAAWNALPAGQPEVVSLAASADGQRLWVSLRDAGIWRSSNGGETWIEADSCFGESDQAGTANFAAVDPAGDTLVANLQRGQTRVLYSTFDGGITWHASTNTLLQNLLGDILVMRSHPNLWIALTDFYVCRTTNYGQTWSAPTENHLPQWLSEDPQVDGGLFLMSRSSYPHRLTRSTDYGATWTSSVLGTGSYGYPGAAERLSNGEILIPFCDGISYSLVRSTDNGQSWNRTVPLSIYTDPWETSLYCLEDRAHPGRLFLTTAMTGGLRQSEDFGQTWWPAVNGTPLHLTRARWLQENPFTRIIYADFADYGLFAYTAQIETWQPIPLPPVGTRAAVRFVGDAVFCQSDGEVALREWESADPSAGWHEISMLPSRGDTVVERSPVLCKSGDTLTAIIVKTPSSNRTLHLSYFTQSTDDGESWQYGPQLDVNPDPTCIRPLTTPTGLKLLAAPNHAIGNARQDVFFSADTGRSWRTTTRLPNSGLIDALWLDSAIWVMEGYDGEAVRITRTTNEGITWNSFSFPALASNVVSLAGQMFCLTQGYCAHWTGQNWSIVSTLPFSAQFNVRWSLIGISLPDPLLFAACENSSSLWMSENLGTTWQARDYELPWPGQNHMLFNLRYDAVHQRLWASSGVGLCYLDRSDFLSTGKPLVFKPSDYAVLSAYPNPFNGSTRIRFDLLTRQKVKLDLYDLQGRHVQTLCDEIRDAGRNEIAVKGEGLASGTYFVRLNSAETQRTEKILLLK